NSQTFKYRCKEWQKIEGKYLKDAIKNVKFKGLADNKFAFFKDTHDPPPNYNIIHFRKDPDTDVPTWLHVGTYSEKGLNLNFSRLKFYTRGTQGAIPKSICSEPCGEMQVKKLTE